MPKSCSVWWLTPLIVVGVIRSLIGVSYSVDRVKGCADSVEGPLQFVICPVEASIWLPLDVIGFHGDTSR